MAKRALQVSHLTVRVVAIITLAYLVAIPLFDKYLYAYSHALANSVIGKVGTLWAITVPLLLPFYVGCEIWWARKSGAQRKGLWIDAALAVGCLSLLCIVLGYSWTHYAMF